MDLELDIYNEKDVHTHTVNGSCCQAGLCIKAPCGCCETVDFDLLDKNGDKIGDIQKVSFII